MTLSSLLPTPLKSPSTRVDQVLDVGIEPVAAEAGLDRVDVPRPCSRPRDVALVVDDIVVVALAAVHAVAAGPAVEDVVAVAAVELVLAAEAGDVVVVAGAAQAVALVGAGDGRLRCRVLARIGVFTGSDLAGSSSPKPWKIAAFAAAVNFWPPDVTVQVPSPLLVTVVSFDRGIRQQLDDIRGAHGADELVVAAVRLEQHPVGRCAAGHVHGVVAGRALDGDRVQIQIGAGEVAGDDERVVAGAAVDRDLVDAGKLCCDDSVAREVPRITICVAARSVPRPVRALYAARVSSLNSSA